MCVFTVCLRGRVPLCSFDQTQCPTFSLEPVYKASRVGDVVPVDVDVVLSVADSALHVSTARSSTGEYDHAHEATASAVCLHPSLFCSVVPRWWQRRRAMECSH